MMVAFLIGAAIGFLAGFEEAKTERRYEDADDEPEIYRPIPMEHTHGGEDGPAATLLAACQKLTRCKRGTSPARLRLTGLFPLLDTLSTKFHGKSRTRHFVPRTQFSAKFPCMCPCRRRRSADEDGF